MLVTLVGGPPWGFRIQGGKGTGLSLKLSKVNPGSIAFCEKLHEGDLLRAINGLSTDGLSQTEARDVIRESGRTLHLQIERPSLSIGDSSPSRKFASNGKSSNIPNNSCQNGYQHLNGIHNGYKEPEQPTPTTLSYNKTPLSREYVTNGDIPLRFPDKTVITDQPPPPGAVLIEEKVTVDGDKVHTDKYYALPVKEVLKETTSTTKLIPAPSKYEGIGPTEEGIPLGLRQSVKKENMSDWYKIMYKTLHKIDDEGDRYVIDYTSDPEVKKEEKRTPKKLELLNNERVQRNERAVNGNGISHAYPASAKSTIETYSSNPRPIADYEPGYSSSADNQGNYVSKRYFPTVNQTKSSYEVKDGYDSDNLVLTRNLHLEPDPEKKRICYQQVQQGGDIPQFGLGKPAPQKPQVPVVGPAPPSPQNGQTYQYQKAFRPSTLPPETTENGQFNDLYADHMRQAIHNELQQKGYQVSPTPYAKSTRKSSLEKHMLAQVLFDFSAESAREISLKKDDIVHIIRELDRNWYEGESNGARGIFPISYVEILPPEHTSPPPSKVQQGLGRVLYDFTAHTSVELSARKGDELQLLQKVDDNWYEGSCNGRKGIIPASYLSVIEEPGSLSVQKRCNFSPIKSSQRTSPVSSVSPTKSPSNQNGSAKKGNRLIEPVPYRALYTYSPQNDDELEMIEGDTVYVVELCDDGWYVGTSIRTGDLGIIPGNYVERISHKV